MRSATIIDALATWSSWYCDTSPLGSTGNYALDMRLADAFRMLLYRPALNDRLRFIERETADPRCVRGGEPYRTELLRWWLDLYDAEKAPIVEARTINRRLACVSF